MKSNREVFSLSIVLALLFAMACTRESQRTEPVTTTAGKATSTAPPAKEAEKRDKALVRVVHALPGFAAVDAFVDNTKEFPNVTYRTVTPYKEVPDVHEQFAIRPAGQDSAQPFAQNREGISGGNHYTAIAMPSTDGKPTLRVVADKLTPPPSGRASVRVIHASPDAGEVDVFVKGEDNALFDGVNTQTVTNYNEVDPMTVTLEVRPQGEVNVLLMVPNVTFEPGHLYTMVVTGKAKGTPKLEVIKIDDKLGVTTGTPSVSPSPIATRGK
jgi:Domain of unknown function (DUF4397)